MCSNIIETVTCGNPEQDSSGGRIFLRLNKTGKNFSLLRFAGYLVQFESLPKSPQLLSKLYIGWHHLGRHSRTAQYDYSSLVVIGYVRHLPSRTQDATGTLTACSYEACVSPLAD